MKLFLNQNIKVPYFKNIKEIDNYIIKYFSDENQMIFAYITKGLNSEKLILHYIDKICRLEEKHQKEITLIFKDKDKYELAKKLFDLLHPKKLKIGLALAGGGARGAYQMGVLEVLEQSGLLDKVDTIIGTSIGAFSMVYHQIYGTKQAKKIWCQLDSKIILTKNSFIKALTKGAFYSREETKKFLENTIDEDKIHESSKNLYIQTMTFPKLNLKQIKINDLDKQGIINQLIRTSSIPFIFGLANMEGEVSIDAGLINNDGIDFLISQGCNVILYVSLQKEAKAKKKAQPGVSIIDWGSCQFYSGMVKGIIDFEPHRNKYKMEYGKEIAKLMEEKLEREGIIDVLINNRIEQFYKLKTFYRLDKVENTIKFDF